MRRRGKLLVAACAFAGALAAGLWLTGSGRVRASPLAPIYQVPGDVNGDGFMDIADAVYILGCLFDSAHYPEGPAVCPGGPGPGIQTVPQTGQTNVWEALDPFNAIVPPPPPGHPFFGQDGSYRAGVPRAFGFIPGHPLDERTWIVIDPVAGLMWECANTAGRLMFDQALLYCENLMLGGFPDWRLANIRELQSIVDFSRTRPAIDEDYFDCERGEYWSSTSFEDDPSQAWIVDFQDGTTMRGGKAEILGCFVRAVRSLP